MGHVNICILAVPFALFVTLSSVLCLPYNEMANSNSNGNTFWADEAFSNNPPLPRYYNPLSLPNMEKRTAGLTITGTGPGGVPDWPLCPSHMDRVECFYSYLSMYVRMRQSMKDTSMLRTVGKRSSHLLEPQLRAEKRSPHLLEPQLGAEKKGAADEQSVKNSFPCDKRLDGELCSILLQALLQT